MNPIIIISIILFVICCVVGYCVDRNKEDKLKEKVYHYRKSIINMTMIIALFLTIGGGVFVVSWAYKDNEDEKLIKEYISNPTIVEYEYEEENNSEKNIKRINFSYLKTINLDTVAWLEVENTNINYPVVNYSDNNYYLKHSYSKASNYNGWIFADYRNNIDGNDLNTIIYGHNRFNGTMFGTLKNVLDEKWIESNEHYYINLITETTSFQYEIFSSYEIEPEGYYIRTDFSNKDYNEFVVSLAKRSKFDFNVDLSDTSKIITLSTCSNDNSGRIVVHAKLINQTIL